MYWFDDVRTLVWRIRGCNYTCTWELVSSVHQTLCKGQQDSFTIYKYAYSQNRIGINKAMVSTNKLFYDNGIAYVKQVSILSIKSIQKFRYAADIFIIQCLPGRNVQRFDGLEGELCWYNWQRWVLLWSGSVRAGCLRYGIHATQINIKKFC